MPQFGSFALLLALALSVYAFFAGVLALSGRAARADRLAETARRAGIAAFVAVTCAVFALVYSAFANDYSVSYIMRHTNRDLPAPYKVSALWSGQEGSLLFWAWLLTGYGLLVRLRHKVDVRLTAYAAVVLAGIEIFFLLLVNFPAHPFALVQGAIPADGNGLNPLLQYPEMVIHPPMLYLGYVGFAVPFAFALGALILRYPGEKWIHITRRWTMVTWGFLTAGIFLGGHWAYAVLGWGGYWAWDPVENASFFPWLTGTAFLHSVMMQEKRGMLKTWNVWLIFATFLLAIFGTFLTRSGIVSSVHAFAQSAIGEWFVVFLFLTFLVCLVFYLLNRDHLKSEHKLDSLVSREASFVFNNVLLLVACFAVLWGTLFPVISEAVQGSKITVGPPFFNRVFLPIAMLLLFLTAVGPLLAWGKTSTESLKRNFAIPALISLAAAVLLMLFGMRPWEDSSMFYALMAITLSVLVTATVASEFLRGGRVISRHTGQGLLASMVHLTRRNTRRYGGYIVHLGVVVFVVGIAGSAFNVDHEQELAYGQTLNIGRYSLVSRAHTQDDNPNYRSQWVVLDVFRGGRQIGTMYPEQRTYKASRQVSTMVAIRSSLREDLYLVYAGTNPESGNPIIKAHVNPLVVWIWIGLAIVLGGTLLALVPNATAAQLAPSRVREATAGKAAD